MARYVRQRSKIDECFHRGEKISESAARVVERPALGSKKSKFFNAVRLYEAAADAYLTAGRWGKAAASLAHSAECELRLGRALEAASFYSSAGDYASRLDHMAAVHYYSLAVASWVTEGRFEQAAACERRLAEVCELDGSFKDAGTAYSYAGELYLTGDFYQQAAYMFYLAGVSFAKSMEFMEAQKNFDQAASAADNDNMMRYRVPSFLLSACLSVFATGNVPATEQLTLKYAERFPLFAMRREKRFMMDMVLAAKLMKRDQFLDHVWNYDYVKKLNAFELLLLKRVHLMFIREQIDEKNARQAAEIAARKAALLKKGVPISEEPPKEAGDDTSADKDSPVKARVADGAPSPASGAGVGLK